MVRLFLPVLAAVWGVGTLTLSLRPTAPASRSALRTERVFGWSQLITAAALLVSALGQSAENGRPVDPVYAAGLLLACTGGLLFALRSAAKGELSTRVEPSAQEEEPARSRPRAGVVLLAVGLILLGDAALFGAFANGPGHSAKVPLVLVGLGLVLLAGLSLYRWGFHRTG